MFEIISIELFLMVLGQLSVRLSAKSKLALPIHVAGKIGVALCLVWILVYQSPLKNGQSISDSTGSNQNRMVIFATRTLIFAGGIFIGESFKPIALTGSIATGKSTVAHMLVTSPSSSSPLLSSAENDVYLIDADSIGHEILLPPRVLQVGNEKSYTVKPSESVYNTICTTFAEDKDEFLDPDTGLIMRRKLGSVIFADHDKRRQLNRITHPRIIQILIQRILYGIYFRRATLCCADVPLLFESGIMRFLFCLVVVVATNPDIQYERLRLRNTDLSEQDCRNRIQSQYPMERKVQGADIVIWNNGTVEELEERVTQSKREIQRRLQGGVPLYLIVLLMGLSLVLFGPS